MLHSQEALSFAAYVLPTCPIKRFKDFSLFTLAYQINRKHVTIDVAPLPEVVGDQISLEQIMSNPLTNALSYLVPERPGHLRVWGEVKSDKTTFYVKDNGRGVTEGEQAKIF